MTSERKTAVIESPAVNDRVRERDMQFADAVRERLICVRMNGATTTLTHNQKDVVVPLPQSSSMV
ncbi:hypothetical protein TSUD_120210 [Trifolium subterraneum]|uniref:Uncharacterized protein n=1 Tax=Trifolium subterraneum TaxID=3900 RepID=A0A2Z6LR05_TRISU|nr:hypothetical protein TSUD_120210 [Trifolium subterraneum]